MAHPPGGPGAGRVEVELHVARYDPGYTRALCAEARERADKLLEGRGRVFPGGGGGLPPAASGAGASV